VLYLSPDQIQTKVNRLGLATMNADLGKMKRSFRFSVFSAARVMPSTAQRPGRGAADCEHARVFRRTILADGVQPTCGRPRDATNAPRDAGATAVFFPENSEQNKSYDSSHRKKFMNNKGTKPDASVGCRMSRGENGPRSVNVATFLQGMSQRFDYIRLNPVIFLFFK
jgi:hypothetical protein